MPRLLLILLLAFFLLPAPQFSKDKQDVPTTLLIRATPVALDASNPKRNRVGRLKYLAGWELSSNHPYFGGVSAMAIRPDGRIIALSDGGDLFGFRLDQKNGGMREFIEPLPIRPAERDWPKWKWDSEGLIHDPQSGRYWVTFELIHRICRYAPAFARVEACQEPEAMKDWPGTGGAEAAVRLPDGRFLIFAETAYGPHNSTQLRVFDHDPAETGTAPLELGYYAPQGYRITDAVWLGGNTLLTLNRRVTIYDGFTVKLAIIDISDLKAGTLLPSREIATLRPPLLADNFEALAIVRENGKQIVWIASDDNHEFFQRTLFLKFELLPEDMSRP
ncbi:MAG: esterase-like activity of phytase family protein [Alphaproteobacteria bacterium]|nr:esterase-like activity of phytase family protein [Alphaproteobacteria bacterium]